MKATAMPTDTPTTTRNNRRVLLTPGPLTTDDRVRLAMNQDWGSRDRGFIELTAFIRRRLVDIIEGGDAFTCVPLQGSGTFSVEATMGTVLPRDGKGVVLTNGAYGRRMVQAAKQMGRTADQLDFPENQPVDARKLDAYLSDNPETSVVFVVHCETTSGLLNPVAEVGEVCKKHGVPLIIDAMSSFGALSLTTSELHFDGIVASSNKCFEGTPGFGYALLRRSLLEGCAGNSPSLSLDLYAQWERLEKDGQWRFTPPTHVLASFAEALKIHEEEGGVQGRGDHYRKNCHTMVNGMREMGFETYLPDDLQAPIIVTFLEPDDPNYDFEKFYTALAERNFVIYPGKIAAVESFRIGCIGRVFEEDYETFLAAVREILDEMGVSDRSPKR